MEATTQQARLTNLRRGALAVGTILVIAMAWLGPLDRIGVDHVDAALKRALVTFAMARTANAIISAIEPTTISVSLGAGVSVQPFQALDPLDDLVEQFSTVMLVASTSLGIQRI